MIVPFQLASALKAMGVAEVFVGDPTTAGGLVSLGATEGEIGFEATENLNVLTANELTGEIAHDATVTLGAVSITVPLIMGDPDLWAKISATGTASGGWSTPQPVVTTSVLLIPRRELGAGISYADGAWTPKAPENAVWLWRAFPSRGRVPFRYADGGKVITEVKFTAMFDGSKPEGHKVFTIGDPTAQGIEDIAL